jgi:hypothetical protein
MSTSERLDMAAFEHLLGIHGSRIERWPESTREPLRRLLSSSELARARWREAESLDALLGAAPEIEPAPEFIARIAALPARHPRAEDAGWWPFKRSLAPLLAWSAAAALGVLVGLIAPNAIDLDDSGAGDLAALDALADDDGVDEDGAEDWTDMSSVAMGTDWVASEDD